MAAPPAPEVASPPAPRLTVGLLVLLGSTTALGPLSIDLYLPGFPALARELGASEAAVQLTLTACVLGLALGQLVAGPLSDRYGRRAPLLLGLVAWSVASVACALAPSVTALWVLRLAQGLAGAGALAITRAVLRDLADGPALTRAFARIMLVVGVVPIAAPTLGGLLLQVMTWRGVFVVLGAAGVVVTLVVLRRLPETLPPAARSTGGLRASLQGYATLVRDPSFVAPALVVGLVFATLFSYVSASPFVLGEGYDLSPAAFGALFGVNSLGLVAGTQLSAALSSRVSGTALLRAGVGGALAAAVLLLLAAATGALGLAGVAVPLWLVVVGTGVTMPVASARAMAGDPARAGSASGLLGVVQFGLGGLLAPVVGAVGTGTAVPLGVLMVGCLVAALVVAEVGRPERVSAVRRRRERELAAATG